MIDYSFPIEELEYFLLILTRISCFVFVAPFFSIGSTPNRVKIGFSFFLSILIYYLTMPHVYVSGETLLSLATFVIKEAAVGLLLGLGAYICQTIVLFAGRIVDMDIGFSMVNAMDPTTRENATITGFYYQYVNNSTGLTKNKVFSMVFSGVDAGLNEQISSIVSYI